MDTAIAKRELSRSSGRLSSQLLVGFVSLLLLVAVGRCGAPQTPQEGTSETIGSHHETGHQPEGTSESTPPTERGQPCGSGTNCLDSGSNDRPAPSDTGQPADIQGTPEAQGVDRLATDAPGTDASGPDTGRADTSGPDSQISDAGPGPGPLGPIFRYGLNLGHRNASWGDDKAGQLGAQAGASSTRKKLPEHHLDRWGYTIEVNDLKDHAAHGMRDHVGFLIGMSAGHSTKPANEPDWKLDYYIPSNLYKPILINGKVNPDNYWAMYVYKTVSQYKSWIKIWEIWNEPDWVANWQTSQKWTKDPPKASDLPRFNGSIFDYVRMLRVAGVAARLADPKALIALGGIGYPSFLSAILRYTDNPADGAVTAEYPKRGGAYFDVLNIHFYPVFAPGNSDVGVDGFAKAQVDMQAEMTKAGITKTLWNATETGAPHQQLPNKPGGTAYARNFLMKVMVTAQALGFLGVDWFVMSDGALVGKSTNEFDFMGLYFDIQPLKTITEAKLTETGWAYKTLGGLLKDARYDPTATKALKLPADAKGAAFRMSNGKQAFVLWAYNPKSTKEDAKATYALSFANKLRAHAWDFRKTQQSSDLTPKQGSIALELTSSPVILIEQ